VSDTNPIDAVFADLRAHGRKAFIPFLTAGDPSPAATVQIARALAQSASLLEIGFPYSDPIADGPVIQASFTRALDRGLKIETVFEIVEQIARSPEFATATRPGGRVPLVGMLAYSLIYRRGPATFLDRASAAGLSGLIVPDLPLEEAKGLAELAREKGLKLILLVTPTTPDDRAAAIAKLSTGFLYCVSLTGITGERAQLSPQLHDRLALLRGLTSLPLCVGFGVSRAEQVGTLRPHVDGVIVGSAIVRQLEKVDRPVDETARAVGELTRELATALAG
jgi:tryptophan synthase alpha chain